MDSLVSQLNLKYAEFKDALGRNSLRQTFQKVYEYFDLIDGLSRIQKAVNDNKVELEKKIATADSREKKRILAHSFSSCHKTIYDKVYLPIKTYRESASKSTLGQALSFPESENVIEFLENTWTRFVYYCSLDEIKRSMEIVHSEVVKKLLELPVISFDSPPVPDKIKIIIDDNKGIYQESKEEFAYSIERISKRMKLIKHLVTRDNCSLAELNRITHQDKVVTMKSIPEINKLFREKLHLTDDLILSVDTGGYAINKEVYAVTIKR